MFERATLQSQHLFPYVLHNPMPRYLKPQSWQPTACCYCWHCCASTALPSRPGPPTTGFKMRHRTRYQSSSMDGLNFTACNPWVGYQYRMSKWVHCLKRQCSIYNLMSSSRLTMMGVHIKQANTIQTFFLQLLFSLSDRRTTIVYLNSQFLWRILALYFWYLHGASQIVLFIFYAHNKSIHHLIKLSNHFSFYINNFCFYILGI